MLLHLALEEYTISSIKPLNVFLSTFLFIVVVTGEIYGSIVDMKPPSGTINVKSSSSH